MSGLLDKFKPNNITELSKNNEDILEKNIVWLFASPRSGTQWIGTKLLKYQTIINRGPSIGLNLGSIHTGFEKKIVRQIEYRGDEPDYCLSKKYEKTWMHFIRKLILNRLYAQYGTLETIIVIPDPEGSIACDIIAKCMPNSKLIILFRDGRDVTDSVIDAAKEGSWFVKSRGVDPLSSEQQTKRVKRVSLRWTRQVELLQTAFNTHPTDLRYKLRYEDIHANTLSELKKIYDFIGIDILQDELEKVVQKHSFENIPSNQKGSGKVTRSASPGQWKKNFSEEEQKIMQDIMGKTLSDLGYS